MNYDKIANMKVDELRKVVRELLSVYNEYTGSKLTPKEIPHMPKARLLYIVLRYWSEVDAKVKYNRMVEELQHRVNLISAKKTKRTYTVTVEEVI